MHPYKSFPDRQFWSRQISTTPWQDVFANEKGKFSISKTESIVSIGSCFAQRISQHLIRSDFNYTFYEQPHPLMSAQMAEEYGYGTFSCRYGNIYTTRQLIQLLREALKISSVITEIEKTDKGNYVDLLRPNINKTGFESVDEAIADRHYHLDCVANMFSNADVLIFTLGLTEAWMDESSKVVFGTHPEVITKLDSTKNLIPVNFDYLECFNDIVEFINLVASINSRLKIILTVSPVGLAATHQNKHILTATSYSKAVLRSVAGKICDLSPNIDYFPSFEIFNSAQSFGQFLSEDLREANLRGVQIAMKNFESMFVDQNSNLALGVPEPATETPSATPTKSLADIECDEYMNAVFGDAKE